jgi:hypothetical protein
VGKGYEASLVLSERVKVLKRPKNTAVIPNRPPCPNLNLFFSGGKIGETFIDEQGTEATEI